MPRGDVLPGTGRLPVHRAPASRTHRGARPSGRRLGSHCHVPRTPGRVSPWMRILPVAVDHFRLSNCCATICANLVRELPGNVARYEATRTPATDVPAPP